MGGLFLSALTLGGVMQQNRWTPELAGGTIDISKTLALAPSDRQQLGPEHLYDDIIAEASAEYGVDPTLVRAVIKAESRFDPEAVSYAGAKGLMQLMPVLQKELGVQDPLDPRQNIFGGTKYLSRLLERHDGDVTLALASYNAGPRNVAKYRGVPPFKETRGYVKKIRGYLEEAKEAGGPVVGTADVTRLGD